MDCKPTDPRSCASSLITQSYRRRAGRKRAVNEGNEVNTRWEVTPSHTPPINGCVKAIKRVVSAKPPSSDPGCLNARCVERAAEKCLVMLLCLGIRRFCARCVEQQPAKICLHLGLPSTQIGSRRNCDAPEGHRKRHRLPVRRRLLITASGSSTRLRAQAACHRGRRRRLLLLLYGWLRPTERWEPPGMLLGLRHNSPARGGAPR